MTDTKMKAWNEISKLKYALDDSVSLLENAKDNYKNELVKETTNDLMKILNEEGTLSERDFKLFLDTLATNVKNLYSR
ncbi:hypothetical protein ACDN41_12380 [Priestia aryabhattai]|uniref:hypothetical protein n=1 Tax=Priestia aryabhattai TaxID=412384 RepID=UPI0035326DEE